MLLTLSTRPISNLSGSDDRSVADHLMSLSNVSPVVWSQRGGLFHELYHAVLQLLPTPSEQCAAY